jgi:hypothetical protein
MDDLKLPAMRRRLWKFAFILSTLLCIALCALWVRSFWIADAWGYSSGKRTVQCGLAKGWLRLDTTLLGEEGGSWPDSSLAHVEYKASMDPPTHRLPATLRNLGFSIEHRSQPRNYSSSLLLIPLWALLVPLVGLTELLRRVARRALKGERWTRGLCPHCGYDLRASPAACPECGRVNQAQPSG